MLANPQTYYGLNSVRVWESYGTAIATPTIGHGNWIYYGETFQCLGLIKVWETYGVANGGPSLSTDSGMMVLKRRRR